MKFLSALLGLVLLVAPVDGVGSFRQDVVRHTHAKKELAMAKQQELLARAMPLADYQAQLAANGQIIRGTERRMEGNDDFYLDDDAMYSFSGFSLKYAQCQPVKYFSEDAIKAGEHSPMVTQDIVILRLCPQKSCSESTTYGCHYNYAEYAIALSDYLDIMIRYSAKKRDALCGWCQNCNNGGRRKLEGDEEEGEQQGEEQQEEKQQQEEEQDQQQQEEEQNEKQEEQGEQQDEANNNGGNGNYYYFGDCDSYDDYCYNFNYICGEGDDDNNMYIDYEGYMDYLDCSEVDYNGYAYFVRPKCNNGKIEMAVYYDNYCVRGVEETNVRDIGLNIKESVFQSFYTGECIDCSENNSPPNFNYGSALCNNVHATSAKCTGDLYYDLFDGEEDDSAECSYIETLRFGTYDSNGRLTTGMSTDGWTSEVSTAQKVFLALSILACVTCIVYACYLHHAMTNLLIKSLSHRELLPPSRHNKGRRSYTRRGVATRSVASAPDWQKS